MFAIEAPGEGTVQLLSSDDSLYVSKLPKENGRFYGSTSRFDIGHWVRRSTDDPTLQGYQICDICCHGLFDSDGELASSKRIEWGIDYTPMLTWGTRGSSRHTSSWLAKFGVFEPGYQVLMAHGAITSGYIRCGDVEVDVTGGSVYCEKNWGRSFPSRWWWVQANAFKDEPDLSILALGAIREVLIKTETIGMLSVHYKGEMYEFTPWTCEYVRWDVDEWGRWQASAKALSGHEMVLAAHTDERAVEVLGPSTAGMKRRNHSGRRHMRQCSGRGWRRMGRSVGGRSGAVFSRAALHHSLVQRAARRHLSVGAASEAQQENTRCSASGTGAAHLRRAFRFAPRPSALRGRHFAVRRRHAALGASQVVSAASGSTMWKLTDQRRLHARNMQVRLSRAVLDAQLQQERLEHWKVEPNHEAFMSVGGQIGRTMLFSWLFEECSSRSFKSSTAFLAVNYMDRMLSKGRHSPKLVQIFASICIRLAVKMEQVGGDNMHVPDFSAHPPPLQSELFVLNTLKWQMNVPTVHWFLGTFAELVWLPPASRHRAVEYAKHTSLCEYSIHHCV
ncbi:Tocopherol cyclase [Gracilaria domingensis]|nr:Tocopherol cyclase [Gracilaria domingensis]